MNLRLLHSPADIIRYLIIGLDLGVQPVVGSLDEWQTACGGELIAPDNVITTYDTAGTDEGRNMLLGTRFESLGVQVRIRASNHRVGYEKADNIAFDFDTRVYQTPITLTDLEDNTRRYLVHSIRRMSRPISLGKDISGGSKRNLFTINLLTKIFQLDEDDDIPGGFILTESGMGFSLGNLGSKRISELEETALVTSGSYIPIERGGENFRISATSLTGGGGGSTFEGENKEGTSIPAGGACAVHSSGVGVVKADATSMAKPAVGLSTTAVADTMSATVQTEGPMTLTDWSAVTGTVTLARGAYFADPTSPGKLTQTVPTTVGHVLQRAGYAVSDDTFNIEIAPPILL